MRALADYAGLLGALFWDPGVLVWTPSDSLILPFASYVQTWDNKGRKRLRESPYSDHSALVTPSIALSDDGPIGQYCSLACRWGFVVIADSWGETPAFSSSPSVTSQSARCPLGS